MTVLTSDPRGIFNDCREHWLRLACATEPLDRAAATAVIGALYRAIGKPRPRVLFFASPLTCVLAGKALFPARRERPAALWRRLRMQLWHQIEEPLWSYLPQGIEQELWADVALGIRHQIEPLLSRQLMRPLLSRLRRRPPRPLVRRLMSQLESAQQNLSGPSGDGHSSSELGNELQGLATQLEAWVKERAGNVFDPFTGGPAELEDLESCEAGPLENCCAGPWWHPHLAAHDYLGRIGVTYTPQLLALRRLWLEQAQHCHWWFPYNGIVLASDRPCTISLDGNSRLHNSTGAALEYRDGFGIYAWHGVTVERHVIADPSAITVAAVERESNAELRRILIERYGWKRYIGDCGAEVVDSIGEEHPTPGLRGARLLRKELPGEPEAIVYLEMVNSTPAPDGTCNRYLERIDPKAYGGDAGRLCHAAMASRWRYRDEEGQLQYTFEKWQDYQPAVET